MSASGEYLVSVKFNDQHIPDSPFKVYLAPSTGDIQKLNISDLQEHGLQVYIYTSAVVLLTCCWLQKCIGNVQAHCNEDYLVSPPPKKKI